MASDITEINVSSTTEIIQPSRVVLDISPTLPNSGSVQEKLQEESLMFVITNYLSYYAHGESHTAKAKRYDLQYFLRFLAGSDSRLDLVRVSEWTLQSTKDFIDDRLAHGEAPTTVSRRLATLKHFGRTLAERVPGYINPAREVKAPTFQLQRPHGLTHEEQELLITAATLERTEKSNSFQSVRNHFLLELLMGTGLRADEVRVLVINQISEDKCWLKNVRTKGRKFRNVYLNTHLQVLLEEYMAIREKEMNLCCPLLKNTAVQEKLRTPLIISKRDAKLEKPLSWALSPKTIWRIISSLGMRAESLSQGLMPNLHPHKLRHTFAHGLLDATRDVRLVAQALGHSDVRTTMRYTERTDTQLANAIEGSLKSPKEN